MIDFSTAIERLEAVAEIFPVSLYWINSNNIILGLNSHAVSTIGAESRYAIIGKTAYELYPAEMAAHIIRHNREVFSRGIPLSQIETVCHIQTGQIRHFKSTKSPIFDKNGKVAGLIGISLEITEEEEAENQKIDSSEKLNILKHLALLAPLIPVPMYWTDLNSAAMGGNEHILKAIGLNAYEEGLGKTPYDFYPQELADRIVKHNEEVIRLGRILSQEEPIVDMTTGKTRYYNAFKAPLRTKNGEIFGTLGISIETTAEKEAAELKLKVETQKVALDEQDKFKKVVEQMVHDIRSPLSSLMIVAKVSDKIPEQERVALREVANRISNITNNLLSNFKEKEVELMGELEEREAILVSPEILQILTEKFYQYSEASCSFTPQFTQAGHFCWIKVQPIAFKRMLSNVINNAVDAYDLKSGEVTVHLDADVEQVWITVEDHGKGINSEVRKKILDDIAVSDGKDDGHGIGLEQVRDTLKNNEGKWFIESKIGEGTKFTLIFPRVSKDDWLADSIQLYEDDTAVILDDDSSVHLAWNLRFQQIVQDYPSINALHFEKGQDAIDFINGQTPENKQKIFLLADYELLKQDLNGLDVISRTQITRCILVTSHYANKAVRKASAQIHARILPKQLASEVPIHIGKGAAQIVDCELKIVDVVFVDDEVCLLDSYKMFAFNKTVDTYSVPEEFLESVAQYPRNTKILLDQNFTNSDLKGIQIAEQLHTIGFTSLYLLSGGSPSQLAVPAYLTFLQKGDLDLLETVLNGTA